MTREELLIEYSKLCIEWHKSISAYNDINRKYVCLSRKNEEIEKQNQAALDLKEDLHCRFLKVRSEIISKIKQEIKVYETTIDCVVCKKSMEVHRIAYISFGVKGPQIICSKECFIVSDKEILNGVLVDIYKARQTSFLEIVDDKLPNKCWIDSRDHTCNNNKCTGYITDYEERQEANWANISAMNMPNMSGGRN